MPITTYQQALDWLYAFVQFGFHQTHDENERDILPRMARLLARLDTPQENFPAVLIAGTKGKGSTAAMLASILRAAGYRVGLYTSPHLHTFRERIRVNDQLISRAELIAGAQVLEKIAPAIPDITWFQLVTALALKYFAEQAIDLAVLEVGLGGRLDATNVVTPRVSVITSISYDHTDVLGSTLAQIAREKAGIIKRGVPISSAPQEPDAQHVIETTARERNAPLTIINPPERISQTLAAQTFRASREQYCIPLLGAHQSINAALALAAARELTQQGWKISREAMQRGLAAVEWQVRFEVLARNPVIIADGAHNRAAAHELAQTLNELFPHARVHLIFGASNDKDIAGMFAELFALPRSAGVASLTLTRSRHPRAATTEQLRALAAPYVVPITIAPSVASALNNLRARIKANEVICVTGSLFVAAEARLEILRERSEHVETDDEIG